MGIRKRKLRPRGKHFNCQVQNIYNRIGRKILVGRRENFMQNMKKTGIKEIFM